jgi:arylsulfatase A-like enzyme
VVWDTSNRSALIFYLAAWFGLVTGLAEVAIFAGEKFFLHQYIFQSPDIIWMAPLSEILVFSLTAITVWLITRRWPKLVSLRVIIFLFAFLSFVSLLFLADWLDKRAEFLLALGLAVQTARWMGVRPWVLDSLLRYTVGWVGFLGRSHGQLKAEGAASIVPSQPSLTRREFLVSTGATIAGLAVGLRGWQRLGEERAMTRLPPALPEAPNVLLITWDTVRAQNMSLYGYERQTTPHLERWAKGGVVFERALAASPWTLPSHGSLFTGRYPHELSANWVSPLDATYRTLAEVLSGQGYVTAGFIANTLYCSTESGLNRGFAHYEDYSVSPGQLAVSSSLGKYVTDSHILREKLGYYQVLGRKDGAALTGGFLRWLTEQGERPFFAFLNYWDAHQPYLPPAPFDVIFGPKSPRNMYLIDDGAPKVNIPAENIKAEIDAYDGAIAYLDFQLGLLLDELQKRGILENTLVILASDHGEEFGEHDIFRHGRSLYMPELHVPLLISYPGRVPTGMSVHVPVSLRDVAATVVDLIGMKDGPQFPGHSLARYWTGSHDLDNAAEELLLAELSFRAGFPEWYPISKGDMKSLSTEGYHYIRNGDGREELYNWEADPWEQHDLAPTESGRRELEHFRASLTSILRQAIVEAAGR